MGGALVAPAAGEGEFLLGRGRGFVVVTFGPVVVIIDEDSPGRLEVEGVGVAGQSAGPGDIAMAGGVKGVAGFGEGPAGAGVKFAEG